MSLDSQTHEISGGMGFAQYYGDLNVVNQDRHPFTFVTESFNPKNFKMSYSLGYRYGFKDYVSLGFNFHHLYLCGYDSDNKSSKEFDDAFFRQVRNLSFYTAVNKLYLDVRFEPYRTEERWDDNEKWLISPYVAGGLGFFHFNPKTVFEGEEIELQPLGTEGQGIKKYGQKYNLWEFCIPLSVGIRFVDPERIYSIGADFTYTYTFTDFIDDVSGNFVDPNLFYSNYPTAQASLIQSLANRNKYGDNPTYSQITAPGQQRGNPRQKDNFMTGQIRFSLFLDAFQQRYLRFR